jgi:peptide/nickel transport system substrate-binding protein
MNRPGVRGGTRVMTVLAGLALMVTSCSSIDDGGGQDAGRDVDNQSVRSGGTVRIGLDGEPDMLDPSLARTLVGRNVFNAICEKLYDVNEQLEVVPQLAEDLPEVSEDGLTATMTLRTGLTFADGTTLDAQAVKMSLDRHRTIEGSARASELSSVSSVEVVDPRTVQVTLDEPFSPLAAVLADRAGMIMSPTALKSGTEFAAAPVCVGPFKFASRVAQDRIEVVKDPKYYAADQVKLDKIVYLTIADDNTRFNNLRSGDIEVGYDIDPINVDESRTLDSLRLIMNESLGYQGITINVGNVDGVGQAPRRRPGPLASDGRVREALSMSIDREALNRTVFRGHYTPACGPISPASPLSSDAAQECPEHDPQGARRLLAEAGAPVPLPLSLIVDNTPRGRRIGEAIKSMTAEGGFDVQIEPTEFASSLDVTDAGRFEAFQLGWSGRVDPDGNIASFLRTRGSLNISGYSDPEVDKLISDARTNPDVAERKRLYGELVGKLHEDWPLIYLWRQKNILGVSNKLGKVEMFGDGIVRFGAAGFVE